MIKVLHILQTFGVGGMENRVARLATGLARKGFRITILTLRPSTGRRPALPPEVELALFEIRPGLHPARILSLARFIKAGGFRIVHTHNWSTMAYGILAARLAGGTLAIHGEHGLNYQDLQGIPWKRALAQKWLARLCHHIVPVHAQMGETLAAQWALDPERITPIPNGVDLVRFTAHADPGASEEFVVGTVGRLDEVKNLPCLLKAFALLKAARPGDERLRLVFVGEGPEQRRLEKAAAELGLESSVTFAGDAADPERWYRRFSVFVNASYFEGMSNTVLEAMACGLPMVVSRVPGNNSWIKEGENALFFTSADASDLAAKLASMRADSDARKRMGSANRRRAEAEFDNRFFLEHYERLYLSLLRI